MPLGKPGPPRLCPPRQSFRAGLRLDKEADGVQPCTAHLCEAHTGQTTPVIYRCGGRGSSKPMASMSRVSGPFSRSRAGWPVETHSGHSSILTDRWKTRSLEARATLTVASSREAPSEGGGVEQPGGEVQGEETARGLSAPLFVSPSEPRPAHGS